jgi:hypothetical protein
MSPLPHSTEEPSLAKPSTTSAKIADSLHLVTLGLPKTAKAAPAKPPPTHHIAVVDCSGSMYADLPKLREQLKKKLPKLIAEGDTFSCIWFSGKKQCGILLEAEKLHNAADLQTVNQVIDRWLVPVGLTGFKDPLELAKKLCDKLRAEGPNPFSLFFMSDGHDNQDRRDEILKAVADVGGVVAAATFVEYGYYADRQLLSSMAQAAGGAHIFAEDFDGFIVSMEKCLSKQAPSAPRVEIDLGTDVIEGIAYALDDGDVYAYAVQGGKVSVPEHVKEVHFLASSALGKAKESKTDLAPNYAALAIFATRMKSKIVFPILKDLADVEFINAYCNCFGKQAYSAFVALATEAAFDAKKRFKKGRDPNRLPREDAFTVLDLLAMLQEDGAKLLLDTPGFRYAKIGRARVDAEGDDALVFIRREKPEGYDIVNLTFNQARPNVSVLVKRDGVVGLTSKSPPPKLPNPFPTFQFKNYAIIKDGLVNVERLPARISGATLGKISEMYKEGLVPFGVFVDWPKDASSANDVVFDLRALPIMNRKSVKETSAKDYFTHAFKVEKSKAKQKVLNAYVDEHVEKKKNEGYAFVYGADAAAFLQAVGITQEGGYAPPHTTGAPLTGDFYMAKTLKASLKGLSSLPKLDEVRAGKGGMGGKLMKPYIEEVDEFLASKAVKGAADPKAVIAAWLEGGQKAARKAAREGMLGLAKLGFNIIVGQVWFSEFASLDETSLTVKVDGLDIVGTAKLEEVRIDL